VRFDEAVDWQNILMMSIWFIKGKGNLPGVGLRKEILTTIGIVNHQNVLSVCSLVNSFKETISYRKNMKVSLGTRRVNFRILAIRSDFFTGID
jgi:hypothetical protein